MVLKLRTVELKVRAKPATVFTLSTAVSIVDFSLSE